MIDVTLIEQPNGITLLQVAGPQPIWGVISGTIGNQADLMALLAGKQNKVSTISTVTYSSSITIDASLGSIFVITITNTTGFTINAPTNPTSGQVIRIRFKNTGVSASGARTYNAVFKQIDTGGSVQPACSDVVQFYYDGTNWIQISPTLTAIPN